MPGRTFLDTNVLVYAQDMGAPAKQRTSRQIIADLAASVDGVISTQVMQEFRQAVPAPSRPVAVYGGRTYTSPVCSRPGCSMCNAIRRQLGWR